MGGGAFDVLFRAGFFCVGLLILAFQAETLTAGLVSWLGLFALFCAAAAATFLGASRCTGGGAASRGSTTMLAAFIGGGLVLRLIFWAHAQPPQFSDSSDYLLAAQRLRNEGAYYFWVDGHRLAAWRPPGVALIYAAGLVLGADPHWLPPLINGAAYLVTQGAALRSLHGTTAPSPAAVVAVAAIALWPQLVVFFGFAASEPLSLAFACLQVLHLSRAILQRSLLDAYLFGAVTGAATLLRPHNLLVVVIALPLLAATARGRLRHRLRAPLWALCGWCSMLGPWVGRNLAVFGQLILVSTNGGDVLYRANNPLASGTYTAIGARNNSPAAFDGNEITWMRTSQAWAVEWIRANPIAFLRLGAIKWRYLLGYGFDSQLIMRFLDSTFGPAASGILLLERIAWVVTAAALCAGSIQRGSAPLRSLRAAVFAVVAPVLATHFVFESQARHNQPNIGPLVVLAVAGLFARQVTSRQVTQASDQSNTRSPAASLLTPCKKTLSAPLP